MSILLFVHRLSTSETVVAIDPPMMDSSNGSSIFVDSEEDEIFVGTITERERVLFRESGLLSRKTVVPTQCRLDVVAPSLESPVAVSRQDEAKGPADNQPENQLEPVLSLDPDIGEKPGAPLVDLSSINLSPKIGLQDEIDELACNIEKDMLLLALQRRFENHKVDLPDLCDLNLDDTEAESESCIATNLCDASLEMLANCSMPQFNDSPNNESFSIQLLSKYKSEGNKDLDTTAKFLEMEKSCMTPGKPCENELESVSALSPETDDLSTVSADEDGGFLSGFTEVALYHATLNRNSTVIEQFSAVKEIEPDRDQVAEAKVNNSGNGYESAKKLSNNCIPDLIDFSKSPALCCELDVDNSTDVSSFAYDSSLNTTFEEMQMLESFGAHYMVGAEKELMKKGLENSMNCSLSKEHQELLDSFPEPKKSPPKPQNLEDESIRKKFVPYLSKVSSPPSKDVIGRNTPLKPTEDFNFPKPLSTVGGSHSKAKYQHQTTPIKPHTPKATPIPPNPRRVGGDKFFCSPSTKSSTPLSKPPKFFSKCSPVPGPNRDILKSRLKTLVSDTKTKASLNIQSPVAHYIHDSPVPSLMAQKHVPFAGLTKNKKFFGAINEEKKASSENIDLNNVVEHMILPPQKSYQSTSSLKMMTPSKTKLPVLSGKSKQLVATPKVVVMKHTGRVKASELPSNSPLSKMPARINDSCFTDRTVDGEVSVVIAKEAIKTSTMK